MQEVRHPESGFTRTSVWYPACLAHGGSIRYAAEVTAVLCLEIVIVARAVVIVRLRKPEAKTKTTRDFKCPSLQLGHSL